MIFNFFSETPCIEKVWQFDFQVSFIVYYYSYMNEPLIFGLLPFLRKRILFFQEYIDLFFFDADYFGPYIELPVIKWGAEKRFVSSLISNISNVFVKEMIMKKIFIWRKSFSKSLEENFFNLRPAKEISQWKQDSNVMRVDESWILKQVPHNKSSLESSARRLSAIWFSKSFSH